MLVVLAWAVMAVLPLAGIWFLRKNVSKRVQCTDDLDREYLDLLAEANDELDEIYPSVGSQRRQV